MACLPISRRAAATRVISSHHIASKASGTVALRNCLLPCLALLWAFLLVLWRPWLRSLSCLLLITIRGSYNCISKCEFELQGCSATNAATWLPPGPTATAGGQQLTVSSQSPLAQRCPRALYVPCLGVSAAPIPPAPVSCCAAGARREL